MKCFPTVSLIFTLVTAGIASDAHAQNPGGAGLDLAKARQQAQQRILERYDANKDGKLTGDEQLRAQEELRRSGRLSGSGVLPGGFPGAEEFLKKFDADGDGKLSPAEQVAAQSAMQRNRGQQAGGGPATGPGLTPNGPAGGNLFGEAGQPAAGKEAAGRKPTRRTNPLIALYDKDGDGKLNDDEKAALQADRAKKKPAKRDSKTDAKHEKEVDEKEDDAKEVAAKPVDEDKEPAKDAAAAADKPE